MKNTSDDEPIFGFLDDARRDVETLREANDRLRNEVRWARRAQEDAEKKLQESERRGRSEREDLVKWLDRRLEQQEDVVNRPYISKETKRVMEIELSVIRRYREIIVERKHTAGSDDPLMPKFV